LVWALAWGDLKGWLSGDTLWRKNYFKSATERLNKAKAQVSMAELVEKPTIDQIKII
jgi:hypothetical protein